MRSNFGFTLMELIVGMSIFGVVGLGIVTFTGSVLGRYGVETKATSASSELQRALTLMASELRMSHTVSPYLVGDLASVITCNSAFTVGADFIRFMVVEDDSSAATSGIQPYYVGYYYDSVTNRLYRGEVAASSVTSCIIPGTDPTSSSVRQILAERVVRIDSDGNGSINPAFSLSGNIVNVSLGIEVIGAQGLTITQNMPMEVQVRLN